ncbi:MAG: hypothetical protein IT561_16690 [Alphaproteobacteria bacterium]|nr:hypothetical protein [Alphaproteobacteria bacterium]
MQSTASKAAARVADLVAAAQRHLTARVAAAPVIERPFPHILVDGILPDDLYSLLLASLPAAGDLPTLLGTGRVMDGYPEERRVLELYPAKIQALPARIRGFWEALGPMIRSPAVAHAIARRFRPQIAARFPDGLDAVSVDAVYCEDAVRYALPPHTDAQRKVVTALIYLPDRPGQEHLGTTLYEPVAPGFRCPGGPHHPRADFRVVATMPYRPNTMFGFAKSDRCFHGVEPVAEADLFRRVLIVNVNKARQPAG